MAKVIGPWTPNYPVDFKSNGDTTRAAFGKHIQEIERIYGLLSGLGASKIEAEDLTAAMTANRNEWATAIAAEKSERESAIAAEITARSNGDAALQRDLTTHINSTNPHPNLQLATLGGNLPFSRIDGSLDMSRTTGNLPSSRVSGNFGTDRIDGLEDLINGKIGDPQSSSSGGYIKIGKFIIQWVDVVSDSGGYYNFSYPIPFPNKVIGMTYGFRASLFDNRSGFNNSGVTGSTEGMATRIIIFGY